MIELNRTFFFLLFDILFTWFYFNSGAFCLFGTFALVASILSGCWFSWRFSRVQLLLDANVSDICQKCCAICDLCRPVQLEWQQIVWMLLFNFPIDCIHHLYITLLFLKVKMHQQSVRVGEFFFVYFFLHYNNKQQQQFAISWDE